MRSKEDIEKLVQQLYSQLGNDPSDLIQIKPKDGDWHNALSYLVTRKDNTVTSIYRRDIDDQNNENIKTSLQNFMTP